MPAPALRLLVAEPAHRTAGPGTAFMHGFSLGVGRLRPAEVSALRAVLPLGTAVYFDGPQTELAGQAALLRAAGLTPIPRLAARDIESAAMLDELVAHLAEEGVRQVLALDGDRDRAAGPYVSALELIESCVLPHHGITEIGIAGHPEGHPRIADAALERRLLAELDAAERIGLAAHIVTPPVSDLAATAAWLFRLRHLPVEAPLRLGVAGPAALATLQEIGARCRGLGPLASHFVCAGDAVAVAWSAATTARRLAGRAA